MQNPLDRAIYHPLAHRLARMLAPTFITPNMVSVAGGLAVVLAGLAYTQPPWPWSVALGVMLHMAWHVLDGTDGDLARMTGRTGAAGEIVDGVCDYVAHAVLYFTLAAAWSGQTGWWIWPLMLAAGASRVVQTNFHEARRRQFMAWAYGVPWLRTSEGFAVPMPFHPLVAGYLWLSGFFAKDYDRIDRAMADPVQTGKLRALGPARLAGSPLLGSPFRTLALGLSMAAGSPVWYFLYEILVLNPVLVRAIMRSRRTLDALCAQEPASTLR
ncbi:MAG: CDP-alcohol phosphatidyltransferase [Citromicrobium sp.]|nr:CDP-alcohol phosphatidyltransferase [Citromicrobium sp.]